MSKIYSRKKLSRESDEVFWNEFNDELKALCARKNCKTCRGKGWYWHHTVEGEYPEADNVRCWCTKPKTKD